MRMRSLVFSFGALSIAATSVRAQSLPASYTGNFTTPTPAPNWSYQASTAANLDTPAAYVNLTANGSVYQAGSGTPVAASTYVTPGTPGGTYQYVVLGYNFTAQQIATYGNDLMVPTYAFNIPATSGSSINVQVFESTSPTSVTPLLNYNFPAGTYFDQSYFGPFDFGPISAGTTLYFALGENSDAYNGDPISVSYTLSLPEPASISSLGFASIGLLARRRRP